RTRSKSEYGAFDAKSGRPCGVVQPNISEHDTQPWLRVFAGSRCNDFQTTFGDLPGVALLHLDDPEALLPRGDKNDFVIRGVEQSTLGLPFPPKRPCSINIPDSHPLDRSGAVFRDNLR